MENKVTFGLKNVHVAKQVEDGNSITYDTPFAVPGAVNFTTDKESIRILFRADDENYYEKNRNKGYTGNLEIADVVEKFLTDILGQYKDANGALFENEDDEISKFALMFEIDGDKHKRRIVFYDCLAERPNVEYATTGEDDVDVKTAKMELKIRPRKTDKQVKGMLEENQENQTAFNNFFSSVYEKQTSASV